MRAGLRCAVAGIVFGIAAVLVPVPAVAEPGTVGAPGIGDPYYPLDGNGGYDVEHYDIRLGYRPDTDELSGTTAILARSTQRLSRFDLDFLLKPSSVLVNNRPAEFATDGGELVVTPAATIPANSRLLIVVRYRDTPSKYEMDGRSSWHRMPRGAAVLGEPHAARWWFPGNDHPRDKATYDVSIAVPTGLKAVSNGVLAGVAPEAGERVRFNWRSRSPQGPYQATMIVGDLDLEVQTTPGGLPFVNAFDRGLRNSDAARASVERTPEFLDFEASVFGPYPFEATGGTVLPGAGGLENQTRPTYGDDLFAAGPQPRVIVHELAHQWFGNSVSVHDWRDIWLSEGFATYAEWLYSEHVGDATAEQNARYAYDRYPADDPFWQTVVTDPGAGDANFASAVYRRGGMALQALRGRVGDATFFRLLKAWTADKRFGNATSAEFEAFAERFSGRNLRPLFRTWLHSKGKPPTAP